MTDKTKILIIDDDDVMLDSCSQVLDREGYFTETARDGNNGIKAFDRSGADAILLDLKMPGKTGMQVLNDLKAMDPDCVVIVITGYGTIQSAVDAMKQGAFDFLPKPFTPDELRYIVKRGVAHRYSIAEREKLRKEKETMRRHFVSLVSHELKAPLAAVLQNLTVILHGMAGHFSEDVRYILDRMVLRIQGLVFLINDWLDLSRIESGEMTGKFEIVDVKAMLTDVMDMLQPAAAEKNIKIDLQAAADFPPLLGYPETLRLLFTNLLSNGIKYNHENGRVNIILNDTGPEAEIRFEDTGIGIQGDELGLVFEEFYRSKSSKTVDGSGLGLCIARRIVESHTGHITVTSKTGEGSVFTVTLPFRPAGA